MALFTTLYSGSSGNCALILHEGKYLLIDMGKSCRTTLNALRSLGLAVSDCEGILITHEHSDHIKGLSTISKKFDIPIYANKETWDAMPQVAEKTKNQNLFNVNKKFEIGDLKIVPFSIPHDAANPCGFNIFYNNQKISIATDIGHIDKKIIKNLEESSFILLESNYDPNILSYSKYPYSLKQRIAGPNGHLSNEAAGKTVSYLLNSGLKNVMLGHLSKENNFPELAYKTVIDELCASNFDENKIKIAVASRSNPSEILNLEVS